MTHAMRPLLAAVAFIALTHPVEAQRPDFGRAADGPTFPADDPVLRQIWRLGMDESRAMDLAQVLMDSVGPRLTASPGMNAAHDWAVGEYTAWGIPARNQQYGTWLGWRRGITHVDLIAPRLRTLEAHMMAWSAGTDGPVEGDVVVVPDVRGTADFEAWLPRVRGNFVAVSAPLLSCRPERQWEEFGTPESVERSQLRQAQSDSAHRRRLVAAGVQNENALRERMEQAGAAGVLRINWERETGINNITGTALRDVPTLDLSCEDYGLVYRLAERGQGPRIRVDARAEYLGQVPVFNTIAEMRGTELPEEYVMLSAHFDSWDAASGATDNGTGTIVMMEAMRILKQVYPNPRRTILVGHWGGEEQGLNGSRAFAHDHPEIVQGLQALFNQDNGTGRVVNISMQGLTGAGSHFGEWLARVPEQITRHIDLQIPGSPGGGGSDYASFICYGAPAFSLSALNWNYGTYTHHTNRDTYDKVVEDDLKNNATLTAMLVYLASEDERRVPRERRVMPTGQDGQTREWPQCRDGARTGGGSAPR